MPEAGPLSPGLTLSPLVLPLFTSGVGVEGWGFGVPG